MNRTVSYVFKEARYKIIAIVRAMKSADLALPLIVVEFISKINKSYRNRVFFTIFIIRFLLVDLKH